MDINKIYIKEVDSKLANRIICNNHYSGTVPKGVKFNLGIFVDTTLYGIAQFGYGIRPKITCNFVNGTNSNEYLELNRLWISDELGANAESKTISLCLKWVKEKKPELKWIISFADGMMGKVGTIYQATNFIYTGFRKDTGGIWLTKDGERLHGVSLWHKHKTQKRSDLEVIYGKPLFNVTGGQHRYFYFYDKKLKKELAVSIQPYPKQDNIKEHLIIKADYNDKGDNWDAFQTLLNKPKEIEEGVYW